MAPIWMDWALMKRMAENAASDPEKRPHQLEGVRDASAIIARHAALKAQAEQ